MITKIRTSTSSRHRNTSRWFIAIMSAALISAMMFVSFAQAGSTDGLAANWKFDETSGLTATDSSGNNTAVLMNGPAWSAGRTGNALSFDGADDHVQAPQVFSGHDITVAFWVKRQNGARYPWPWIIENNFWNGFLAHGNNAGGELWIGAGGSAFASSSDPDFLPNDQWVHVVYTRSDKQRLYRNGALYGEADDAPNTWSPHTNVGGTRATSWKGQIDEVRIYTRSLSLGEIQTLYVSVAPSVESTSKPTITQTPMPQELMPQEPMQQEPMQQEFPPAPQEHPMQP